MLYIYMFLIFNAQKIANDQNRNICIMWKIHDVNYCKSVPLDKLQECYSDFSRTLLDNILNNSLDKSVSLLRAVASSPLQLLLLNTAIIKNINMYDNDNFIKPLNIKSKPKSQIATMLSDKVHNHITSSNNHIDWRINNLNKISNNNSNFEILTKYTEDIITNKLNEQIARQDIYFYMENYDITNQMIIKFIESIVALMKSSYSSVMAIDLQPSNIVKPITFVLNNKKLLFKTVQYNKCNSLTTFDFIDPLTHLVLWMSNQYNTPKTHELSFFNNELQQNIKTVNLKFCNTEFNYTMGNLIFPEEIYNKNRELFDSLETYCNIKIINKKSSYYMKREEYNSLIHIFILTNIMNNIINITNKIKHINIDKRDIINHAFKMFNYLPLLFNS